MALTVVLVAPVAPPAGGIATWTEGLLEFSARDSGVTILHINSAVRFRSFAAVSPVARVVAGLVYGTSVLVRLGAALLLKHIDVAHICSSGSLGLTKDLLLLVLARVSKTPSVLHFRFGRLPALATGQNWETKLVAAACRLATRVVVLDGASLSAVRSLAPRCSACLIPNPAWHCPELPTTPAEGVGVKVIVFVGHVTPVKGVRELVLACREIDDQEFRLDLIGPCREGFRRELLSLARSRSAGAWLSVPGEMSAHQVAARIAGSFATILPSYTEGFPNVVLEAMAAGKPVIATAVGAVPEMLSEGGVERCGICVAVRDVESLRSAIRSLLLSPTHAAELGRRGRERVIRDYSPETVYPLYRSLWTGCRVQYLQAAGMEGKTSPLTVLLIAPICPPPGGIATWAEGLRRFASLDNETTIYHLNSAIRFRSIGSTSLWARGIAGTLYSCITVAKLAVSLISKRAAVIHICTSGSLGLLRDLAMSALSRIQGHRVIMHFHFGRLPAIGEARNWEAVLTRAVCRIAPCAVVLDGASADALRTIDPGCRVLVIPNPAWDLAELAHKHLDLVGPKRLMFVGHVTPAKGVRELVQACCQLGNIEFSLHLVGPIKSNFRVELEALARTRAGGQWLTITGSASRKEVLSHIAGSFAVILPSYSEGFPITLLEAMAQGKPVIATRVGAIPEMLQDSGKDACGICVAPLDIDSLRCAILALLEQPAHAAQLGIRGRERVLARYAPEIIYPMYRSLWHGSEAPWDMKAASEGSVRSWAVPFSGPKKQQARNEPSLSIGQQKMAGGDPRLRESAKRVAAIPKSWAANTRACPGAVPIVGLGPRRSM